MRKLKESELQKLIMDWLHYNGYLAVKFPSVGIYKQSTGRYIPQPRRGISDILACSPSGRFVAIECKVKGRQATPEQLEFLAEVEKRGGVAIVAYSVDDVEKKLKNN